MVPSRVSFNSLFFRAQFLGAWLQGRPGGRFTVTISDKTVASLLRNPAWECQVISISNSDYLVWWPDSIVCLLNLEMGRPGSAILEDCALLTLLGTPWYTVTSYLWITFGLLPHVITMQALLLAVNHYHPGCPPGTPPSPTGLRKPPSWAIHVSDIQSQLERLVNHLWKILHPTGDVFDTSNSAFQGIPSPLSSCGRSQHLVQVCAGQPKFE